MTIEKESEIRLDNDLNNKSKEIINMLKFAVENMELGHNLDIDYSGNQFIKSISNSNNIVEFINTYMDFTETFINEISRNNEDDIKDILTQYVVNYLKFKKGLIEKCYQSINNGLEFYVLIKGWTVDKEIEIMDKIIDFNLTYVGQKFNISVNVYDVSDYENSDFENDFKEINL
ncbi:MAG TPA: hypothetical protein PLE30_09800 [Candidatus Kapabacteria bacterium]|nr:hypothetical protein [Candidatus Kapabacteria bacterium]